MTNGPLRRAIVLTLLAATFGSGPTLLQAQQSAPAPSRRFDAEVAYLTFSWVRRPTGAFGLGPEVGGGFLQQVVISPSGDSLTGLVHIGLTSTIRAGENVDVEVGVRVGAGELRSVACAGCIFSPYGGAAFALFAGYPNVRFGTRLVAGRIENGSLLTWSPLVVRAQF